MFVKIFFFIWTLLGFLSLFFTVNLSILYLKTINIFQNVFNLVGRYQNNSPLSIEIYFLLKITIDLFLIISFIQWFIFFEKYLSEPTNFHLSPIINFAQLEFLEEFFQDSKKIFDFNMFIVFILLVEIIFHLNSLFPSFGIHFLTFSKAKVDLLMFLMFGFILLIGFTVWANISFGSNTMAFSKFDKTLIFLLQYVI